MKIRFLLYFLLATVCSCGQPIEHPENPDKPVDTTELRILWNRTQAQTWAGCAYGRVHMLNDGRLMASFEGSDCQGYCRFSSDNGNTWTAQSLVIAKDEKKTGAESTWTNIANCEFAQLSSSHPDHPGRIIYAANIRPSGNRSDIFPYSICCVTSDDGGASWSSRRIVYSSRKWSSAVARGCWEPFVLELPGGLVQIYFSDETPYWASGDAFQNISVIESKDGGDTWGEPRIVAYTSGCRDGMPVAIVYDNSIYLAIEHYRNGTKFYPQIVWNQVSDNWASTVYGTSGKYRFDPMKEPLDSGNNYYGAPYLIRTDNYFVLSYQSSVGSNVVDDSHSVMEVVACPKSEMSENIFRTMRGASRPVSVNQAEGSARWNSLCDLGNDEILAVSDIGGSLVLTRGIISGTK